LKLFETKISMNIPVLSSQFDLELEKLKKEFPNSHKEIDCSKVLIFIDGQPNLDIEEISDPRLLEKINKTFFSRFKE
jgi:hypothetical protein